MQNKEEKQQINKLTKIIKLLEKNTQKTSPTFKDNINLYGTINYSRTHYFPKTSSYITANPNYTDIFYNYTQAESMILDTFLIIESDIIKTIEDQKQLHQKIRKLTTFSLKLLKILLNILETKHQQQSQQITKQEYEAQNNKYSQQLYQQQNKFYTLVYDEKIDSRIKQ